MSIFKELIILITVYVFVGANRSYENYKLYGLTPTTEQDVHLLEMFAKRTGYDFWNFDKLGKESDLMIEPSRQQEFMTDVKESSIVVRTKMENVQKAINDQKVTRLVRNSEFTWDSFHNLDDINAWLQYLADTYPEAELIDGGDSYEGRDILGIKIKVGDPQYSAVIEGGIHSREWISPATVTYILHEFLTSEDPEIRHMVQLFEWHIFPVVNPDGYVFTFNGNRMWRKTRKPYEGTCSIPGNDYGADLNRNYGYLWNTIGASDDPCSEVYAGPTPFSEIESLSFSQYVSSVENLKLYLAFHSYTQLILVPYSHTMDYLDNYANVFEISVRATDRLKERFGTTYTVGHSTGILYPVSGSSFDWVKGELGIDISLLYELRDEGEYGFLLPAEQIIPNNLEVMDSLKGLVQNAQELGYFPEARSENIMGEGSALSGAGKTLYGLAAFLTLIVIQLIY